MKRKVFFFLCIVIQIFYVTYKYRPVKCNKISEARTGLIRVRTVTGGKLLLLR